MSSLHPAIGSTCEETSAEEEELRANQRRRETAGKRATLTRLHAGSSATLTRRELNREKAWSRIYLVPLLLAEQDRDAYRRQQAANAREAEIMKDVPGWEVGYCLVPRACSPRVALNHRPERACTTPRGTRLRRLRFCKEKRMYHHCTEAASVETPARGREGFNRVLEAMLEAISKGKVARLMDRRNAKMLMLLTQRCVRIRRSHEGEVDVSGT